MPSNPQRPLFTSSEQGSIHAILIAHPSTRLYAHPLEWKEQLQYLSCQLHPTILSLDPKIVKEDAISSLELEKIEDCFFVVRNRRHTKERDEHMFFSVARLCAIATGSQPQSLKAVFRYNGHKVAYINLPLAFCNYQSIQTEARAWAYIDSTSLWKQRIDFHRRQERSYSYATRAIEAIKDLPIDPLYVAILIALAQGSRAAGLPTASKRPQKILVSLFVPEHAESDSPNPQNYTSRRCRWVTSLRKYTATITDEYLQKFDDPHHFHDSTLHIHQTLFSLDSSLTIFQAIKAASQGQIIPSISSTVHRKRKALGDIAGEVNKMQRTEKTQVDEIKKRGAIEPDTIKG